MTRCLQLFGAVALLTAAAHAEIEFVGVLLTPGRSLFALSEAADQPAAWRNIGQTFAGYSLASFDAKNDTLTLSKDGAIIRLPLKDAAKIKNAHAEFSGTVTFGSGEKLDISRVTLTYGQETVLPLQDGVVWRVTPTRLPDGNVLFRLAVERTTQDGGVTGVLKVGAPAVITRPNSAFSFAIGDLQFNFNPIPSSP